MANAPAGYTCYHCKEWVGEGKPHDCWTTTEAALTRELSEDLRDAWERLRDTAAGFGEQRIYASHHSIMFARKACYFFVRPKRSFLELNVFLDRTVRAPQVKRVIEGVGKRRVHVIQVRHRDEVEAPITGWLREAYDLFDTPATPKPNPKRASPSIKARRGAKAGSRRGRRGGAE
jgi:hypothetical protein